MLTNATVKAARPGARPYKLADAGGLYLYVRPNGRRTWRMKFRLAGREQLLTFGDFPDVDLGAARELRDGAREQLGRGEDPRAHSAPAELVTFEALARRWHEEQRQHWSAEHGADVIASLERDVFPAIGALAPAAINARRVRELLRSVEDRGCRETARRLRERVSGVFRLGIHDELCSADPAAIVADRLGPRPLQTPQPAIVSIEAARTLLADVDALEAGAIAKLASRFLALTAVRLGTLRGALRAEIEGVAWTDPDAEPVEPLWRIPPGRLKLRKARKADPAAEHVVPLSREAVAVLRALYALTGPSALLFPGRRRGRPIGEGAIGDLYDRAGYAGRHVPHGWRATFSTILNERFPEEQALIDQALAHVVKSKGKVEGAYNRAQHLVRLRDLFQRWAALLAA